MESRRNPTLGLLRTEESKPLVDPARTELRSFEPME